MPIQTVMARLSFTQSGAAAHNSNKILMWVKSRVLIYPFCTTTDVLIHRFSRQSGWLGPYGKQAVQFYANQNRHRRWFDDEASKGVNTTISLK